MSAVKQVLMEQIKYFYLIKRLSLYELKSKNKNNYLGVTWEILNPGIQLLIYWFVFGTLLQRSPVIVDEREVSFVSWLMAAFFLWTFFYQSTIQGSKSIYSRLHILSKMNFPMSIIPSYIIFSQFYVHLSLLLIVIIILQLMGYYITIYFLQLVYFMFAGLCLVFAISLITSTLSTIIRDVHMLLNSVLRMMLYISGVLWPLTMIENYSPLLLKIMKLNPLYYVVEGYRSALLGSQWYFINNWQYTLYFWFVIFVMLYIGSILHIKFRRHFIDYL